MKFHIITLFPNSFDSYLGESILSRAIEDKKISVKFYNPRDYSDNKYKRIDQKPYSGGPGMVVQALPVIKAIDAALKSIANSHKSLEKKKFKSTPLKTKDQRLKTVKIVWFSPSGKQFDTEYAKKTAKKYTDIIMISGRYEGIDARVKKVFSASSDGSAFGGKIDEISVGPYVLTGGELPAMIMIDCISRQIEGVLGNFNSLEESRTASSDVYTRPEVFEYKSKKYKVPKVLLSGDHKKIEEWRISKKSK